MAGQALYVAFRLWVGGLAEVRAEAVVRGEPHVNPVPGPPLGGDAGLHAAHPADQHRLTIAAQDLEALGQQAERGAAFSLAVNGTNRNRDQVSTP
jgi:hypothetical protein